MPSLDVTLKNSSKQVEWRHDAAVAKIANTIQMCAHTNTRRHLARPFTDNEMCARTHCVRSKAVFGLLFAAGLLGDLSSSPCRIMQVKLISAY